MPAEWAPHERTWMAWPSPSVTFEDDADLDGSRDAWGEVARTIARFEPVTVVARPEDAAEARERLGDSIEVVTAPLDDAWMRDMGPTFLTGDGGLAAADWTFNGWGAQEWAAWEHDSGIGAHVAERAGARRYTTSFVNEGGGIHVDGEGTVLLTETVQLDPGRNPGWTRERVERELHGFLGTSESIWLRRGLTADYGRFGTRGHVDIVAAFVRPGVVVVHSQQDRAHPDHAVSQEVIAQLRASTDARGRRLEVIELPAPEIQRVDGELVDYSYVNHYLCNGAVILCAFDDPADKINAAIFQGLFPDREIVLVDARTIFAHGGGIHCITQQQPKA
jgi:agmatine deiminase